MNPCRKYRKQIAWLAMDALEIQVESKLLAHLKACAACRCYLEEISNIAGNLRGAEPGADIQPTALFHRRVAGALSSAGRPSGDSRWNWRFSFAVGSAAALAILVWVAAWPFGGAPRRAFVGNRSAAASGQKADQEPTFFNYESAAHKSLDKLDELLTEQGERNQDSPPIFTAGTLLSNSAE